MSDQYVHDMLYNQLSRLYNYIKNGDIASINEATIKGVFDITEQDNWPIIYASMYGSLDMVKFISSLPGVDASAQGNKALVFAAFHGKLDTIKYLLTLPSVLNKYGNNINDALLHAVWSNNLETVKFLLTLPGVDPSVFDNEAIIDAARKGRLDMIKLLLTCSTVDVNCRDNAVIWWAARTNIETVEFLLTLPNVDVTRGHNAPIRWAMDCGKYEIVAMLLYWEPNVKATLDIDCDGFPNYMRSKKFHRKILDNLVPIAHKISVCFVELPTPIIIEIIDQSIDFAIYVPYHIKWNMVVKIKH